MCHGSAWVLAFPSPLPLVTASPVTSPPASDQGGRGEGRRERGEQGSSPGQAQHGSETNRSQGFTALCSVFLPVCEATQSLLLPPSTSYNPRGIFPRLGVETQPPHVLLVTAAPADGEPCADSLGCRACGRWHRRQRDPANTRAQGSNRADILFAF